VRVTRSSSNREGRLQGADSRLKVTAEEMEISRLRAELARVTMERTGFHQEPLEVMPAPSPDQKPTGVPPAPELPGQSSRPPRQIVNANSGFIIAFDLQPAITAIHNNPIGPLRAA
jgi:hypothetical protein